MKIVIFKLSFFNYFFLDYNCIGNPSKWVQIGYFNVFLRHYMFFLVISGMLIVKGKYIIFFYGSFFLGKSRETK